jgi:hypothetical protein
MNKLIFGINFDGTIVEHKYPNIGELLPQAKETINMLYDQGHIIIIWTCRYTREDLNSMETFLKDNNIHFHKINENADQIQSGTFNPSPKIFADVYFDDRSFPPFPGWDIVYGYYHRIVY